MLYLFKTIIKIIVIFFIPVVFLSPANNIFADTANIVQNGVITAFRLNVRLGPSMESKIYYVLKEGTKIKVHGDTGEVGNWIQIEFDGHKGYVRNRSKYLRLIETIKINSEKNFSEAVSFSENTGLDTEEDKKILERKIQQNKKKILSFSKEEKIILESLNEIDSTLNESRVSVSHLSENLEKLDSKIQSIVEKKEKIIQEYDQKRIYSGTRLNALYRMRMLGKFEVVSEPESIFYFILQQRALEKIIESDLMFLDEQLTTMQKYEKLENELKQNKQEKLEIEKELNHQILITEKKSKQKNEILAKIRTEKNLVLATVKSLQKATQELDRKIDEISKKETVKINSGSFFDYHGKLSMPVEGKIISTFGAGGSPDNKSFTFQSGIDIRPEKNDAVKAVFYGQVIFAKWFQGYGNLMIIDHGDSYYTLYAHNKELLKKNGDLVETGEVIAIAGDTGSIKGLCLHFEIRYHGKPINPMKWLKQGA